jgi:hypothetical protein
MGEPAELVATFAAHTCYYYRAGKTPQLAGSVYDIVLSSVALCLTGCQGLTTMAQMYHVRMRTKTIGDEGRPEKLRRDLRLHFDLPVDLESK